MTQESNVSANAIEKMIEKDTAEREYRVGLLTDDIAEFIDEYQDLESEPVILDAMLQAVGEWYFEHCYEGLKSDLEFIRSRMDEILENLERRTIANWTKKEYIPTEEEMEAMAAAEDGSGCECGNDCGRCETRSQIRSENGYREIHVVIEGITKDDADRIISQVVGGLKE